MIVRLRHRWLACFLAATMLAASPIHWLNNVAVANPVTYFEIPVTDMDRAVQFYSTVFGYSFERTCIDGYEMALFTAADNTGGAAGALARGDVYVPSKTGVIIYFSVQDIDAVLALANAHGGATLYAKKSIGELGFVAEIEDSEGNRIALHSQKRQ